LHIKQSYHFFIYLYLYIIFILFYFIVLHFINKSPFIILLETVDSIKYFVLLFSFYIIYYYKIWGGVPGLPRPLGGSCCQYLRLTCLHFVDCCVPVLYYIILRTIFIFLLVCIIYTLVVLACKLCVLRDTNTTLCIIIQLHFIHIEVFQLEALMCYSKSVG
jgi:hypothetical protein